MTQQSALCMQVGGGGGGGGGCSECPTRSLKHNPSTFVSQVEDRNIVDIVGNHEKRCSLTYCINWIVRQLLFLICREIRKLLLK